MKKHLWFTHEILAAAAAVSASIFFWTPQAKAQTYVEPPQYPQYVQYPDGGPPVIPSTPGGQVVLDSDQIDQLLAPIALYPDPLLSLIFPAATYPQDVRSAEQWLEGTPNPTESDITAQPWDDSIKGLVHYPTVLKMMSDQLDWTHTLGAAFLNQQQDVMNSVQRLRAAAQRAQNLKDTEQAQIISDDGAIRIEPVNPDLIYVPQYDPIVVYENPYPITFSVGFPLGFWCDNDFDWHRRDVIIGGGWFNGWRHPADWDRSWQDHSRDDRRPGDHAPRPWTREARRPAPRITPAVVSRTGLDRPRTSPARTPANTPPRRQLPSPLPVGKNPTAPEQKNVFTPSQSRDDINRARQRVQPAQPSNQQPSKPQSTVAPRPATEAPKPSPSAPRVIAPEPRAVTPPARVTTPAIRPVNPPQRAVAPATVVREPAPIRTPQAAPRVTAPPAQAPGNAFRAEPGNAARVDSNRGRTSNRR